jgi:hypothetical protein
MNKGFNLFLYATHKPVGECSNNMPVVLTAELQGSGTSAFSYRNVHCSSLFLICIAVYW